MAFLTMHLKQRLNVLVKGDGCRFFGRFQPNCAPVRFCPCAGNWPTGLHRGDRIRQKMLGGFRPAKCAYATGFSFAKTKLVVHRTAIFYSARGIQQQHLGGAFHLERPGQITLRIMNQGEWNAAG